jgi:hypothetical protein
VTDDRRSSSKALEQESVRRLYRAMATLILLGKIALLLVPLVVMQYVFYRRWRRQYGGGSWLKYSARAALGQKSSDDSPWPWMVKVGIAFLWFVAWSQFVA